MERIGAYLLQVTAAAVISGVLKTIVGQKGSAASLVRILCAVFMALTILSPLTGIDPERWSVRFTDFGDDAQAVVEDAKLTVQKELATDIKKRTEAYILDKAKSFGVTISVEVSVSSESVPVPTGVRIAGAVPPYTKERLSLWLREELGIPLEEQEWANSSRESS
jgi:hypothetical protein